MNIFTRRALLLFIDGQKNWNRLNGLLFGRNIRSMHTMPNYIRPISEKLKVVNVSIGSNIFRPFNKSAEVTIQWCVFTGLWMRWVDTAYGLNENLNEYIPNTLFPFPIDEENLPENVQNVKEQPEQQEQVLIIPPTLVIYTFHQFARYRFDFSLWFILTKQLPPPPHIRVMYAPYVSTPSRASSTAKKKLFNKNKNLANK